MSRTAPSRIGAAGLILSLALAACDTAPPGTSPPGSESPSAAASGSSLPPAATEAPATEDPAGASEAPSTEPGGSPLPSSSAGIDPFIVSFTTPKQEDCTNETAGSVHVSWEILNATGVSIAIDGPGIYDEYDGVTGSIDVPYGCDTTVLKHTYTLKTIGGTGIWMRVTHTIRTRAPSIVAFSVDKPDCGGPDQFVGTSMRYEVRAATGAELRRDGAVYSTYAVKATDDIVLYDCTKASQTFKLTTTGGYGDAASKSVSVSPIVH